MQLMSMFKSMGSAILKAIKPPEINWFDTGYEFTTEGLTNGNITVYELQGYLEFCQDTGNSGEYEVGMAQAVVDFLKKQQKLQGDSDEQEE